VEPTAGAVLRRVSVTIHAMTPDLTDDDKAILAALLRETIAASRFPLSLRANVG
jgi:hypothetical protein